MFSNAALFSSRAAKTALLAAVASFGVNNGETYNINGGHGIAIAAWHRAIFITQHMAAFCYKTSPRFASRRASFLRRYVAKWRQRA